MPHGVDTVSFAPVLASEAGSSKLRADLLATWIAVTNAGGSVGFTAPADRLDALGTLRRGDASVGMGLLVDTGSAIRRHWRTLLRVMVRPELQGTGAGRLLLEGLHQMARDLGLEQLQLTVRSGERLESFYERFGYVVVGRHPGAVRVARGDDRDEVMMVARL